MFGFKGQFSRGDIASTSAVGFQVVTKQRIKEIRTEVNDIWARNYAISYGTADNEARSIISSITESGQDDDLNTTALPAESYTYQTASTSWSSGTGWSIPEYFIQDGDDQGVRLVDANGDGLVDIVRSYSSSTATTSKVYINDGDSWELKSSFSIPEYFVDQDKDLGVRFADVSGDGLYDLIRSYTDGTDTKKVYVADGQSWDHDSSWSIPEIASNDGVDLGVLFVDVNGDGLSDLIRSYTDGTETKKVYLNDGDSWEHDSSWSIPVVFVSSGADQGVRVVDVNNDGLVDLVKSYKSKVVGSV